nr:siderophore-interacting protein [Tsukamurella ocularis]
MTRVCLGGDGLRSWVSSGVPDERITIAIPAPNQSAPPRPRVRDGRWHYQEPKPLSRAYTVRRVNPGTIVIDFVVHEGGAASSWATSSQPGDIVGLSLAQGWYRCPRGATAVLLVGDATALPAMSRIIEEAPAGLRIHAIAEVATPDDKQVLASRADVTYEWILGTGMGRSPSSLPSAVLARSFAAENTYVWVAAEAGATQSIRKILRREREVSNSMMTITGYWRSGAG